MLRGRARSVRSRIVLLLVPPITALVVLWGVAATTSLQDSLRQAKARTFTQKVLEPTDQVVAALQDERRMSLSALGDDATIGRAGFEAQRAVTDRARARFRASAADGDIAGATRPETRQRMVRLADMLGGLEPLRATVDDRSLGRAEAMARYTEYIEQAAEIYDEVHSMDPELVRRSRILRTLERARENLSREDALVTGALAAGRLSEDEHLQLVQFAGTHRFLYADAARNLPDAYRIRYARIVSGPEFRRFEELQNRLMRGGATGGRPAVDIGAWHTATEAVDAELAAMSSGIREENTRRAGDEAGAVLLRLGLTGGLGLVAVIASILIAVRAGRRLIVESREMAATVNAFAQQRLPEITERARRGEEPPADDGPGGGPAGRFRVTEVEQIDRAFAQTRRAVVRAAEGEARAHRRLNEVFVTLARRNQSLLQRLLRMLETMERGTEDPDELERLFELDALATRMRRHAEGLVILSGRPSGRTWRDPVRMVDVARAAAAEVEDYARVEVVPMGRTALLGPAVADTIHLMAELIENAAAFSPPSTPIRVTGQEVAHGFALEVEDRGLGMAPEVLADLNRLLATDPELDLDDSARLGLFVVARLSARHGIQVTLRPSPYGGIVAIALIPKELVVERPSGYAVTDGGDWALPASSAPPVSPQERLALVAPPAAPAFDELSGRSPGGAERSGNGGGTAGSDTSGEWARLPVRRRQAHLAPQLRRTAGAEAEPEGPEPEERSPEAARDLVSTMQRGWERGRAAAAEDGAGEDGPGESAASRSPDWFGTPVVPPGPDASAEPEDGGAGAADGGSASDDPSGTGRAPGSGGA
ncbi:nitrate- and nitrite sensing domain-containing protein [Spirillospora sp. NPDC048819]|uniref:sensor histidine kinase n=1 Tax=Spirillospora sp. NPDC048819 TaxID=3155268 RepID=UPI0034050FF8